MEVSNKKIRAAFERMIHGKMIKLKTEKIPEYKKHSDCLFSAWMYILSISSDGKCTFCTKYHYIFKNFSLDDFEI